MIKKTILPNKMVARYSKAEPVYTHTICIRNSIHQWILKTLHVVLLTGIRGIQCLAMYKLYPGLSSLSWFVCVFLRSYADLYVLRKRIKRV